MTTATYETDFYLWTQQQADLLRQGRIQPGRFGLGEYRRGN